jgi:hypothetical protein
VNRTCLEAVAACAANGGFVVLRMNSCLRHFVAF